MADAMQLAIALPYHRRLPRTRHEAIKRLASSRRRRGIPSGLVARVGLSAAHGERSLPPIRVSR
jgi:hypothetical protein